MFPALAWLVLNTAGNGRPLPLKGSVGVTRRIAWIVVATLGVAVAAHAQTAGTAPVPQTVQERVDALARQLRDLERELALSDGTADGTVATRDSTPAAPTPNPSPAADAVGYERGREGDALTDAPAAHAPLLSPGQDVAQLESGALRPRVDRQGDA